MAGSARSYAKAAWTRLNKAIASLQNHETPDSAGGIAEADETVIGHHQTVAWRTPISTARRSTCIASSRSSISRGTIGRCTPWTMASATRELTWYRGEAAELQDALPA